MPFPILWLHPELRGTVDYRGRQGHTLYNADVEAEPTANATPMMESAWKLSAYAIMTMPVIAIIAATICQTEWKEAEKKIMYSHPRSSYSSPPKAAKYLLKTNYLFCHQCLHLRRVSVKETSLLTPQAWNR